MSSEPEDVDSVILWREGEEYAASTTQVTMKESGEMHVGTRHYLAAEHLWTAEYMAHLCRLRQEGLKEGGHIGRDRTLRSLCTLAVLSSVAFLEARVNEIWQDAADAEQGVTPPRLEGLSASTVARLRELWVSEKVERSLSVTDKYRVALVCADKERMDKGAEPLQSAVNLINLRNELVHFKPELQWHGEVRRLEAALRAKFEANPLVDTHLPWYPEKALAAGCAEWSCSTAVNLVDEWQQCLGLVHGYRRDVDAWEKFPTL